MVGASGGLDVAEAGADRRHSSNAAQKSHTDTHPPEA